MNSDFFGSNPDQREKNFFDFEDDESDGLSFAVGNDSVDNSKTSNVTQRSPTLPKGENPSAFHSFNFNTLKLRVEEMDKKTMVDTLSSTLSTSTLTRDKARETSSPRNAIERIVAGDFNTNLSTFRGKEEKLELLDYALLTCNVNVITKIIVFLKETLKASIFHYEISRRPVAADHYLIFLRNTEQTELLLDTLAMLGRNDDHAFAMYSRAMQAKKSPENQIRLLNRTLQSFTSGGSELTQWQSYIKDQVSLLEQQLPIEVDDLRRETEEKNKVSASGSLNSNSSSSTSLASNAKGDLFVLFPRPKLIGLSVIETLHYCILYHFYLQDNNFASPVYIKNKYSVNEKQYLWTALQALSKAAMWPEVDNLFEYKSWLGSRKIKNTIPIEDIVRILHAFSAPLDMLEKYLELLDDSEKRYSLAREFLMNKFAADVLIKLKDRKRLAELRASISTAHEVDYVQRYIDNTLNTSTIKWKN